MKHLLLIVIASGLWACAASPARQHFLLQAQSPGAWQSATPVTRVVGVGPVKVADYLTRPTLTVQNADGSLWSPARMMWAEPLQAGIARVIALNLTGQHADTGFTLFPWRRDQAPSISVRLDMHDLSRRDQQLWLSASWSLWTVDQPAPVIQQHFYRSTPLDRDNQAVPRALSALLQQLSDEIAPHLANATPSPAK
ncbi:PqiC family protein [Simiduia agarivorans]|uniref:Lipoprotein n=1 Tax=Simiduia agarivorans (strain DSM 21679 / JCM 13881 / BCRC 17597 / SA1) TaxID=1117647 RepID=K4KLT9_SIMAS|nr:PqiC family protein [Simiduia agarivorans]AFU99043.1 putative lipoprotein [Simiduia agarivorans SA1 = DSM 21679]